MESSTLSLSPSRIAFGSCNHQDMQNDFWPIIAARKPAAFVWGGDSIYADLEGSIDWTVFPPQTTHECATPDRLRLLYQQQLNNPGYRKLLEQNVTIFGTFDDHDFGCNNGDRTFSYKHESAIAAVDFLGIEKRSAMRIRAEAGHGVYGVKMFDFSRPIGQQEVPESQAGIDADLPLDLGVAHHLSNQTVAIFVLDVRTSKTPWKQGAERFRLDYEGDYLGEHQWEWFQKSIRRSRASVNVVVNGLQVFANRYPDGNTAESWERYPRAQQRLLDALLQDGVESPILISGDVHKTELMRKDCVEKGDMGSSKRRSLMEMTTSGMTHSWGTIAKPISNPDYKPTLLERYQVFAKRVLIHSLHTFSPWNDILQAPTYSSDSSADGLYENGGGEGAAKGLQYSLEQNFGELEVDWDGRTVTLRSVGKNAAAPPLLVAKVSMEQLSGRAPVASPHLSMDNFRAEMDKDVHRLYNSEWVCINHRGRESTLDYILGHCLTVTALFTIVPLPILLPVLCLLLSIRRWSQHHASRQHRNGIEFKGRKRRILKRMVKSRIPKGLRQRHKAYASLSKQYHLQGTTKFKATRPSGRDQIIPISFDIREMPLMT